MAASEAKKSRDFLFANGGGLVTLSRRNRRRCAMIKHGYCPTCGSYTAESSYVDLSSLRNERADYQTDEELAGLVRDALTEEGVDLSGMEIRVLNAVVTLLGKVPNRQGKRMAAEAAYSVPAVIDVNNQLVIERAPQHQQS
jgi:hypothetical protein